MRVIKRALIVLGMTMWNVAANAYPSWTYGKITNVSFSGDCITQIGPVE